MRITKAPSHKFQKDSSVSYNVHRIGNNLRIIPQRYHRERLPLLRLLPEEHCYNEAEGYKHEGEILSKVSNPSETILLKDVTVCTRETFRNNPEADMILINDRHYPVKKMQSNKKYRDTADVCRSLRLSAGRASATYEAHGENCQVAFVTLTRKWLQNGEERDENECMDFLKKKVGNLKKLIKRHNFKTDASADFYERDFCAECSYHAHIFLFYEDGISLSDLRQDISNSWTYGRVEVVEVTSEEVFRYMVPGFTKEFAKERAFINKLISDEASPKEAYKQIQAYIKRNKCGNRAEKILKKAFSTMCIPSRRHVATLTGNMERAYTYRNMEKAEVLAIVEHESVQANTCPVYGRDGKYYGHFDYYRARLRSEYKHMRSP